MTHRAFVAFAGGGAKGVVHVGALKALEERDVELKGLAGTSAGAIVAALVAAGFRSDDLIDGASGSTILERLSDIDPKISRATDLFGKAGWLRVRIFRLLLRQPLPFPVLAGVLWAVPLLSAFTIAWLAPEHVLWWAVGAWPLPALLCGISIGRWLVGWQMCAVSATHWPSC